MTTDKVKAYEQLNTNEILVRLQDVFNELQLLKIGQATYSIQNDMEMRTRHIGYLQRGILEAKRIIKECQQ